MGYHQLAEVSIVISIISVFFLLITLPNIHDLIDLERDLVAERSAKFRKSSDELWTRIVALRGDFPLTFFSRSKRGDWLNGGGFCKGCFTLACPMGMPGPPGNPGPDGKPGDAGKPGKTGDDGYDVQLETEPEMPCVVCPAGPPGPRGQQGERGLSGSPGTPGLPGPDGSYGVDGPHGMEGMPGIGGLKGPVGARGPPGDITIAGVGIKGPVGPPGMTGMKGRPGPPGKSSNSPGNPGPMGTVGAIGATGKQGGYGMEGPSGSPGDPGMPSSYCPSDCGVQNILTEMIPMGKKSRLNDYGGPPGATLDDQSESKSYGVRTNSLSDFERRLRKKMIKKMLALRRQ